MTIRQRLFSATALLACCLTSIPAVAAEQAAGRPTLTFFGWSDQHVQTDGNGEHLLPAIDAMNTLPGTKYPPGIGGEVDRPAFVLGCGDVTEWPTTAAKNTYDALINKRLKFPSYDVLGNHDEGGQVPSQTVKQWIIARHGSLSYTFERHGVHFIAVFSKYDESLGSPAQPITQAALRFIRKSLAEVPKEAPVVVATHLCFDAMTNRDDLAEVLSGSNVILVLGGHYHKAKVNRYRGIHFVQLPSPAPNSPSEVTVIRIASDRLVAIPYDYQQHKWPQDPGRILDLRIRGPQGQGAVRGQVGK